MPRVIHFEIHTDVPERAIKFYREVFGWEFSSWGGPHEYWLIKTGADGEPGINGGLMKRPGAVEGQGMISYICTIDVPNVDEYAQKVEKAGGANCLPKMAVPGVGWLVYYKDTEGNIFGMMQADASAA